MDELGTIDVSWVRGFTGSNVLHIEGDVICYICGSNVKFVNTSNKVERIFSSLGNGITALATSPRHHKFAVAEACLNPKIYVCEYPTMEVTNVLQDGADLEYKHLAFSSESYMASFSAIPDFAITIWDWTSGEVLCKYEMKVGIEITSLSFNPLNSHQICACGPETLHILSIEKCNKVYMIDPREIILRDTDSGSNKDEEDMLSGAKSAHHVQLTWSSKARLVGPAAKSFKAPHMRRPVVIPTSHCWSNRGKVYVGCAGGELLSVDSENGHTAVILASTPDNSLEGEVVKGMMNTMSYNSQGLYCGGTDGIIRRIAIEKKGIKITKEYEGTAGILSQSFSLPNFVELVFATASGALLVFNLRYKNCRAVVDSHIAQFVGAGYSDGGNICVSCRHDGTVELWESELGGFVSRISVEDEARTFAVCPSNPIAAVGTSSGHIYHIDLRDPKNPRIVQRQRLHYGPVDQLLYTSLGLHLISSSSEERHIYVLSGRPDFCFQCVGYVDCLGFVQSITTVQHQKDRSHFAAVIVPFLDKNGNAESDGKSEEPAVSDRIVIFSIPNNDEENASDRYQSSLKNFKDNFIKRITFDLTVALDSAIITDIDTSLHVFAVAQETRKLLQFKFPLIQDGSISVYNPSHEVEGHQLPNASLSLSTHLKWILSYCSDGTIILRDKALPLSSVVVKAHSYLSGGVTSALLSPDGQKLITTGKGDMCLVCYTWTLTMQGHVAMTNALEYARNLDLSLRDISEEDDDVLANLKTWQAPEKDKQEENTWHKEQMIIAHKQENLVYDEVKQKLRNDISELQKTILDMMAENLTRPEVEQLNQEEYNLDVEQQKELQEMEEQRVQEVREGIEFENLAEKYLKYIMQKEFWDDMVVKGRALKAFHGTTCVMNYSMTDISQAEVAVLNKISKIRAAEIEELAARKAIVEISSQTALGEEEEDEDDGDDYADRQLSLHGSVGPKYGGENELFYSQFDMHTREEKINQILFLKNAIRKIKLAFNKEFANAYQNKEQEIARAKEKNIRIREILQDLGMDASNIKDSSMDIDEKPEKILTVTDEEVAVERVLSLEEQKLQMEEMKLEQARLEAAKSDNKRERGLQDMMDGVLEVKKEDILKQDIPLPDVLQDKAEGDRTEEEKKLMKEYEKKQKDLQEEREKYRKNLENESKKLQQTVTEGMAAFDEQLLQLYNRKVKTEMVINQEESKIFRLASAILIDDEINTQEQQLNFATEFGREKWAQVGKTEAEVCKLVDEFREMHDSVLAEDKLLDRSFKRDFSDVPLSMVDALYKMFKRRPRIQHPGGSSDKSHNFNPYSLESLTAGVRNLAAADLNKATFEALLELDDYSNAPEGADEVVWQRLCASRKAKLESELRVKKYAAALAQMMKYLQHLHEEIEMANSDLEDVAKQQNKLSEDRMRNSLNLEIQFLLKQGQVEVETGSFIADYTDSILIHRPVVEDLNASIRGLGEQKVAAMTECKDFRKGIHQLEWEHKRMMMQTEDLNNKARHIQMLKLAKDLQLYLSEKNHQAKQAKQMQVLEETLALQDKHLEKNTREKQAMIHDLERSIRHRQFDNKSLEKETEELHVAFSERKNIDDVNAAERTKNTADSRLRGIVQRRKLVDLAKAQAQEVAVLRAEVERLRMKTFPALVQIER